MTVKSTIMSILQLFGNKKVAEAIDVSFIAYEKEHYNKILLALSELLVLSQNMRQATVVNDLIVLLDQEDYNSFLKLINCVDMWGGSGAVWEVGIEDKKNEIAFQTEIIKLITLMEKTKAIQYPNRISPISILFKKELSKNH